MSYNLKKMKSAVYDQCNFEILGFQFETESQEYDACQFELNNKKVISRNAKITPKKTGQFVTFWKRKKNGPIEPFHEKDQIDFYTITVRHEDEFGQFVFPKSILIKKGIISTEKKEGKRGFRVYPPWDISINKQAQRTQKWQLEYFYEINSSTDLKRVVELFQNI